MTACSTVRPTEVLKQPAVEIPTPVYKLKGYDGPSAMANNEVVQASKQCLYAKLKPNVQYIAVRVDTGGKTLVPVDVHCESY